MPTVQCLSVVCPGLIFRTSLKGRWCSSVVEQLPLTRRALDLIPSTIKLVHEYFLWSECLCCNLTLHIVVVFRFHSDKGSDGQGHMQNTAELTKVREAGCDFKLGVLEMPHSPLDRQTQVDWHVLSALFQGHSKISHAGITSYFYSF